MHRSQLKDGQRGYERQETTIAAAASHPNYTAVRQGPDQTILFYLMVTLQGFLFI